MFCFTRTGLAGLALALPFASAFATVVPQATNSERRVWPSISDPAPFAGEIEYDFDHVLNRTQARFKGSLGSRKFLVKLFLPASPVHTLIATYEFDGRVPVTSPDFVRLTLISDEYRRMTSQYSPLHEEQPILVASLGDSVLRYRMGIAQKVEEFAANNGSRVSRASVDNASTVYMSQLWHEIHIERTATATIPICDFLALVNVRSVHGTVAGLEFDLNEGIVSGLRRFAAQMNHGAGVSGKVDCP